MLFVDEVGSNGPLIVMLHWLSGSSGSWQPVSCALAQHGFHCVAIDLPGFGHEFSNVNTSIPEVTQQVVATIGTLRTECRHEPWLLAGHSMGGKLSMILARMALDGNDDLRSLSGLVLVSPSPPDPEPMSEKKRADLANTLGPSVTDKSARRQSAEKFIDDNTGLLPLLPEVKQSAITETLRMNPNALMAWLADGSKEDWSNRVGKLSLPALICAGSEDKALGPDAQREHTLPHLAHATLVTLQGGSHLAPLERPAELADRITEFCENIGLQSSAKAAVLSPGMTELIASDQTSPRTRQALLSRLPDPLDTNIFSADELRTLRALVANVVPDAGFDLTARLTQSLSLPQQSGWRFDRLPPGPQAWKLGLHSLDLAASREFSVPFLALDPVRQRELLIGARQGELGKGLLGALHIGESENPFDSGQMRDWFEDVRGTLAKLYVADPRAMERIGFTGFADEQGFTNITLGNHDEVSS